MQVTIMSMNDLNASNVLKWKGKHYFRSFTTINIHHILVAQVNLVSQIKTNKETWFGQQQLSDTCL